MSKRISVLSFDTDTSKFVKSLIVAFLSGIICSCALLVGFAFLFSVSKTAPMDYLSILTIFISAFSALVAGFIGAKINKQNGLLVGAISGLCLCIAFFLAGLMLFSTGFSVLLFIKLFVTVLSGSIGGILGVNQKKKEKF